MRICIDLDGVLCEIRRPGQSYADVAPIPGAAEKLRELRRSGHEVVIATSRHMKTCDHNLGKVVARQGLVTLQWLDEHGFEYDEIWFGKPYCDVYLDDNAVRFKSWDAIAGDGTSFSVSHQEPAGGLRKGPR